MKILIDANVLLDVALARPGLHEASGEAISQCVSEQNSAFVAWHTLSNICYILRRQADHDLAVEFVEDLLQWVPVVAVGHADAVRALGYAIRDVEDALQLSAAEDCSADVILTRNVSDFRDSPIPACTPEDFNGKPIRTYANPVEFFIAKLKPSAADRYCESQLRVAFPAM